MNAKDELRRKAEETLQTSKSVIDDMSGEEIWKLVHELQVHQIELELQNEELRTAQAHIEASRRRYADLYDFAPVGYCTLDQEGFIREINLTAANQLGVERALLLKRRFYHAIVEDNRETFYLHLRKVFSTGTLQTCEIELMTRDGSQFYACLESIVVQDTKDHASQCRTAIIDVTERRRAEEALQASETKYHHLFESANDSIFIIDPSSHSFVDVNQNATKRLGYTREELLQLTIEDIATPIAANHTEAIISELKEKGSVVFEHIHRRKDGTDMPVEISSQVIVYSGRKVFQSIVRDTTERKRAETELKTAKQAAEASNQAKSTFLANMSHDLRTPLNAILGYAQILKKAENLTERQREELETIKSSGEHLLHIINDILDLSKIEAGHMELYVSEFHLPEFLKRIASIIRIRAEQQGISFVYENPLNLPVGVRADEKRLREVLINLLDNAVKFTKKGTVSLRVAELHELDELHELGELGTPKLRNSTTLRFEVEDTGIGIAPEKLQEIFLPFHQLGGHHSSVEGTGLGLAISRKLVEIMGGELLVNSTVNKGSVFWFELHLPEVPGYVPRETSYGQRILGYKGERRSVLVVDDIQVNRTVLMGMLLPLGFDVIEAENGQECVEKTLRYKPDLILLDLRMPILDGFVTTRRIRDTRDIRDVVIIAVSASVFEATQKRALQIGCNDFLIKPVHLEELVDSLHTHLRLEWVYEETFQEPTESDSQTPTTSSPRVSLLPEDLEILLNLASKSRIKKLLQHLSSMEARDKTYSPFIEEMRHLAKRFQSKEIVKRLQRIKGTQ